MSNSVRKPASVLGVSVYDRVAGLLVAALCIFGCLVGLMFLIWVSNQLRWPSPSILVTVLDSGGGGRGAGSANEEPAELDAPVQGELATATLILEEVLNLSSLQPSLEVAAELTVAQTGAGWGKRGKGPGRGDFAGPREGPSTDDAIPAWERWELRWHAENDQEYAAQLDFFQIELGVAGGGSPVVTYVSNVSGMPLVRSGQPREEARLRFMHRSGALRDADRRLLRKAGIDTSGKVVFQFYSPETYQALLKLEAAAMAPHTISQLRRTVFGVRNTAGRYEFFVISQEYL